MIIVWDEPKRAANIVKHQGLDFADLTEDFFLNAVILPVRYGRLQAVGRLQGRILSVVFVRYGTQALSVISMRPAGDRERKLVE
jgi:uncharacterized DUF497 family protein